MEPRISIVTLGVADLPRAIRFYRDGLGFETEDTEDGSIAFFKTRGTTFALYPRDKLAADISPELPAEAPAFSGVTLAHVAREFAEVEQILLAAVDAGGTLAKPAARAFWGGYSGYFADLDGHFWEVAYWEGWRFHPDGSLVIGQQPSPEDFPQPEMELTNILVVSDISRARQFYSDALGAKLVGEYGGSSLVYDFNGAWLLVVTGGGPTEDKPDVTFAAPDDPDRVSHSITIRVKDCRMAYETLRSRGVRFLTPPVASEWEIRAFFRDPDGHLFEISQVENVQ